MNDTPQSECVCKDVIYTANVVLLPQLYINEHVLISDSKNRTASSDANGPKEIVKVDL